MTAFRDRYGAGPVHLLMLVTSVAIAAYALSRVFAEVPDPARFFVWFGGAIVAHDLVLYPLYAVIGLIAKGVVVPESKRSALRLAALNHLRAPALVSALLLLVWFPLVLAKAPAGFERTTGLSDDVYLGRWLLLSAVLFAGSAVIFAIRLRRLARA